MKRSLTRWFIGLAIVIAGGAIYWRCTSCSHPPCPPPYSPSVIAMFAAVGGVVGTVGAGPCTGAACGGTNSPYTNVFPVNGLNEEGKCNVDGIRLAPHSLHSTVGSACPVGSSLAFDAATNRLVGKKYWFEVCSGNDLQGAAFTVEAAHSIELTIGAVRNLSTEKDGPYQGYRIEFRGQQLCDHTGAVAALAALGFTIPPDRDRGISTPTPEDFAPGQDDDLAVAIDGPIFSVKDAAKTADIGFFNIACSGDALAKAVFYHLNLQGTPKGTTAALRMITARYDKQQPFTVRGATIDYDQFVSVHGTGKLQLEAMWDLDGHAICLPSPRLVPVVAGLVPPKSMQDLPPSLLPNACLIAPPSNPAGSCGTQAFLHGLRAQTQSLPSCAHVLRPPGGLTSSVDAAGNLVLRRDHRFDSESE